MKLGDALPRTLILFVSCSNVIAALQEYIMRFPLDKPVLPDVVGLKIPTVRESAVMARRILHLENVGTISTVFPSSSKNSTGITALGGRPSGLEGTPIGLMEYFADCEPHTGNPTILAVSIATSFINAAAGSNVSLSLRWHPPAARRYSAAALPRFSLLGYLEDMSDSEVAENGIKKCFTLHHPDAVTWMPGNDIHKSRWVRLVVEKIFWFGGFGDRAYIGWIPKDSWTNVSKREWESIRLPGEEKWRINRNVLNQVGF